MVIRKRDLKRCTIPSTAASGQPKRHHTRIAQERIEAGADHPGEDRADQEAVPVAHLPAVAAEIGLALHAGEEVEQNRRGHRHHRHQHQVHQPALEPPGAELFAREVAPGVAQGFGQPPQPQTQEQYQRLPKK